MRWIVAIGDEFKPEFDGLHEDVRSEILALARLLQQFGPQLGRPRADTLIGARHANIKELRFSAADGSGESPLLLMRRAKQSCSSQEINRVSAKSGSTGS
jgi:hypothetical protein